jgi:hypothetical protein
MNIHFFLNMETLRGTSFLIVNSNKSESEIKPLAKMIVHWENHETIAESRFLCNTHIL